MKAKFTLATIISLSVVGCAPIQQQQTYQAPVQTQAQVQANQNNSFNLTIISPEGDKSGKVLRDDDDLNKSREGSIQTVNDIKTNSSKITYWTKFEVPSSNISITNFYEIARNTGLMTHRNFATVEGRTYYYQCEPRKANKF